MIYAFEDYELDLQVYELRHVGTPCKLEPQAFNVLAYLLQHRDRVVTKDELLEHLWPNRHVGEASLTQRLMEVRKAIGDNGHTQRALKTVRGRGYRFVAAVTVHHEPLSTQSPSRPASTSAAACGAPGHEPVVLPSLSVEAVQRRPRGHQVQMPEAQRCPVSGTATSFPTTSAMEQEYKRVTVLCCALVHAPARAMELGAEGMHVLMHTLLAHAQHTVQRYAGSITHWDGDGFTALFGAPVAYEDHAWRAVLAACDLQEQVRQPLTLTGHSAPLTLSVRMGLHTGTVVVGRLAHLPHPLYTATGATTHLASRLQQLAAPGTLLISDTTYGLVQAAVQVSPWGRLDEPAMAMPCTVYTVHGVSQQCAGRPGRSGRQLSRFVGRERELALLHACLAQVMRGQGQVVGIMGEPGIGKSRLLSEFHRQLRGHAVTSYVGRCLSYGRATPYVPVISLLREVCGMHNTDPMVVIASKLRHCLQAAGMMSEEWGPYLQGLLGLPEPAAYLGTLSPEVIKRRTFAALRRLYLALSQQRPLVLTLEDAHWLDQTSADFFATLVDSLAGASVLLLVAYRSGYQPPWLDKSYATQLALPPLPVHESQCLVASLLPAQAMSPAVLQALLSKADGNPFFLEELTQTMLASGETPAHLTLPDTIHEVLMARMDRLPEPARRLLQMASILGRVVSVQLLRTLWDDPGEIDDHLALLQRLEFLYEQVGVAEPQYAFKHALTQEVAYTSILHTHRQAFHTTIGQTLEAMYADHLDDVLEHLAYHYGHSTDAAKAVTYLRQLGAQAARSFAHVEAVTAYQQALPHVEHLPAGQQDRARLDLLLRLAFSLSILGRFRDILDLLLPQQERLEHLQEPALMGSYYFRLGITCIYLGTIDQSMQHAQRALAAARHCHDRATLGMSHRLLAWASTSLGRYPQGMRYGRKAVALLENTAERHWLGLAYWDIGMSAAFLGKFEAALEALSHTRMLGEVHEDPRLQHLAESSSGWIAIMRGEWEAGITACQRILAHSPDPVVELISLYYLGIAYLEQGDPARAIALLEQVVHRFQHIQIRSAQGRAAAVLAEALLLDKQIEPADHMARQGLAICQETSYPYGVGLAQRSLGRIAQAKGDDLTAAQFLHEALHTFITLQARYELARTHLLLAEFAHQQGNREALSTHLFTARQLFQLLHVPHYVARTEHLAHACERLTSPVPGDA
jgi:class 3 adenylate cyclase/DNA-binding winged helix-turn-helix (wHTH) protein/tetratricopeptide (TPR) repeat protein